MENVKTRTLKDTEAFSEIKEKKIYKWGIIFSQHSNSFQFYTKDDDYYVEVGSHNRGYVADRDSGGFLYDIAASPSSPDKLREKILGVLRCRIEDDYYAINQLIDIIREEKDIKIDRIKRSEIRIEDREHEDGK